MQKSSSDDLKEYFKERFDRLNLVRLLRQIFSKNYSMKQSTDSKINIQDEDVKRSKYSTQ